MNKKRSYKKATIMVATAMMLLVFSIAASAAQARSEVCGVCRSGRMVNNTRTEEKVFAMPCAHGYGGVYDFSVDVYRSTYYECNVCHVGMLVSQQKIDHYIRLGH